MANNTTTLSAELSTYYVRTFLLNANNRFVNDTGLQKRTIPAGDGATIHFDRYTPLAPATTPLTEGSSGSSHDLQVSAVTATVNEYGDYSDISKLLSATSIDLNAKAKIELFRNQMRETFDVLIRNEEIANGTAITSNSTNLTAALVKQAVKQLEINNAFKFDDGYFIGIVGPYAKHDLMADSHWLAPHQYADTANIYKGEIGSLYGVRFLESSTAKVTPATSGVAGTTNTIIYGKEAVGMVDLSKDKPKLYINGTQVESNKNVTFDNGDKSDPLHRKDTIGWAGSFAAKVLNPNWIMNISTTATGLEAL